MVRTETRQLVREPMLPLDRSLLLHERHRLVGLGRALLSCAHALHLPPLRLDGRLACGVVHLPPDGAAQHVAEVWRDATLAEEVASTEKTSKTKI